MNISLNPAALDAMLSKPKPVPAYVLVYFRGPEKGARWRRVGRYSTEQEALTAISSSGDWQVRPVFLEGGGPTLFDEVPDDQV